MGTLIRIVFGGLLIYGVYCLIIFLSQRALIFPRYMMDVPPPVEDRDDGREIWWLETDSGRTEVWFLPPGQTVAMQQAPIVIFAHGNAEIIDFWPGQLRGFTDMGFGVLLVEYPGYGRSKGSPSQQAVTQVFLKAYDRLVARPDVDPRHIVLVGRSLGSGAVCALAAQRPSKALILMSGFTSIRNMSWRFWAPPFLVRDPFDNVSVLRQYPGPVLVIHGRHDDIIPYAHGQALARTADKGKLITYACGHNDCPPNWSIFWKDVRDFFYEAGISTAGGPGEENGGYQ